MTNKSLLEFSDKMNPASVNNFANLHARGDDIGADGRKIRSNIGILVLDYSQGKGSATKRAEANVSPAQARYIFERMRTAMEQCQTVTIFESSKIFGTPDQNGYAPMTLFQIYRQQVDQNGEVKKYPWTIAVDNGRAIKVTNANGSAYAKGGTFQSGGKIQVSLSDQDFYIALSDVVSYISVWEVAFGAKLIRDGHILLDEAIAKHNEEQALNPKSQQPPKQYQPPQGQNTPPQSQQSSPQNAQGMTLEQARDFVINIGTHKGKTLGQLEQENPKGVSWYLTANKASTQLKSAAQIVMNSQQQMAG